MASLKIEHGIRVYKPTMFHDDEDDTEFEKRRMYVMQSDRDFKFCIDQIGNNIRSRGRTRQTT